MNVSTLTPTSTAVVDLNAYAENLRAIQARLPEDCSMMPVVKANGYGHGLVEVAKRAVEEGVTMLAVGTVEDGVRLREAGIEVPILVMIQVRESDLPAAIRHRLRLAISDYAMAEKLGESARRAGVVMPIHVEIDTGMGRQGFSLQDADVELRNITRISNVDIEGIFTHFAMADNTEDPFTESQIKSFRQLIRVLDREGIPYEMVHASNSGGILNYPHAAMDLVRPGLISYGVLPSTRPESSEFKPVLSWTTTIVLIRDIPGGTSVSYNRTYFAPRPLRLAALPIGYAHGYQYGLSNKGEVLIRGVRCPVRGLVTMNETMVDVTKVPDAQVGDKVTLIGQDGKEHVTVEELAQTAQVAPHSILTGISALVAREYRF